MRFKLKGREQDVSQLYIDGKSTSEIGKIFGVSHPSIRRCLMKTNTPRRTRSAALLQECCKRGHLLSGDNLYLSPKGQRGCFKCRSLKPRETKFGISPEKFEGKLAAQRNCCMVCKRRMDIPCVDHDHETKQVRDLLCRNCNLALGYLQDDILILESALAYLKKWKTCLN
jgi:DNA-binding CsgD family transcriptional regulator